MLTLLQMIEIIITNIEKDNLYIGYSICIKLEGR